MTASRLLFLPDPPTRPPRSKADSTGFPWLAAVRAAGGPRCLPPVR